MASHLLNKIEVHEINAAVSAGTNDTDSDILDMAGFDGVMFVVPVTDSVATGTLTLTMEQSATNSAGTMAATVATTTVTCAVNDDINDTFAVLDVVRPSLQYVRLNFVTATANIATGNVIAVKYRARDEATTQPSADVSGSAVFVNPAAA
jgi:hypothetical protein